VYSFVSYCGESVLLLSNFSRTADRWKLQSDFFAHFEKEQRITFIELYHKNDKENEDRQRIIDNFK